VAELRELREQDRRPARTRRVFDGPAPSTHGTTRHAYRTKPVHPARTPANEHDFQPGDRVVVTNGTKRGLEGRVFQVARQQVTFRDQTGYTFVRKYTNFRKVNDNTFSFLGTCVPTRPPHPEAPVAMLPARHQEDQETGTPGEADEVAVDKDEQDNEATRPVAPATPTHLRARSRT
jgi:hypothetical protein